MKIPFNKPYSTGNELKYIIEAIEAGKISGNGIFTQRCQDFFENRYKIKKSLLTTSCTDALEMAAILCNIEPGDEVIVPSFTFVSSALAFVRQGANVIFCDSMSNLPNIDVEQIEQLITSKTKVIVPVHYAGVACDMDRIMEIAARHNLIVVEDAAQGIESFYKNKYGEYKPLGTIGHFGTFSFHETKNIQCGEGGLLAINDDRFLKRSEIIWEKGTNRAEFFRGEVNKYGWVDTGSSFLPSEIIAAFLWAQLENINNIQTRRTTLCRIYMEGLRDWALFNNVHLPILPEYATNNGHMFYMICPSVDFRSKLINYLKNNDIFSVFHYLSLHESSYYKEKHDGRVLSNSDFYSNCLLRLPLYYDLNDKIDDVIKCICNFKY